jgi:hypothetical protein
METRDLRERRSREFPDEKRVYMQLAKLEAQAGNYQGVVECIRKETDRNPAVDADWKL